ncbi:MAG: DUF4443 domain-containing protein, partial [Crenarchaeota archaeon]|nr:DUF4443 domain-containing protein [Thermoproteota archaeon]
INRLFDAGLIVSSSAGCILTAKGITIWQQIEKIFPCRVNLLPTDLIPCKYNYAFLVKGYADRVGSGIIQRDKAVFAGAEYAVILIYKNGCFCINCICEDINDMFPDATNKLFEYLTPTNGDVVIIAGAKNIMTAMYGAFAASWSLINDEVKI